MDLILTIVPELVLVENTLSGSLNGVSDIPSEGQDTE